MRQNDPKAPAAPEPAPEDKVDPQQVARIVERYRAEHRLAADELEPLVHTVQEALGELSEPAPPATEAPHRRPRQVREDPMTMRRWQRLVMAAIGVALLVLIWQRLAWIG